MHIRKDQCMSMTREIFQLEEAASKTHYLASHHWEHSDRVICKLETVIAYVYHVGRGDSSSGFLGLSPMLKLQVPHPGNPLSHSWAKGPPSFFRIPQTLRCRASPWQTQEVGYSVLSTPPSGTSLFLSCWGPSLPSLAYSQNLLSQLSMYLCINKIYVSSKP